MELFIFLLLAVIIIAGNALILLRTAKKPKLPKSVRPQPYGNDD
jgi:hypothetical protein